MLDAWKDFFSEKLQQTACHGHEINDGWLGSVNALLSDFGYDRGLLNRMAGYAYHHIFGDYTCYQEPPIPDPDFCSINMNGYFSGLEQPCRALLGGHSQLAHSLGLDESTLLVIEGSAALLGLGGMLYRYYRNQSKVKEVILPEVPDVNQKATKLLRAQVKPLLASSTNRAELEEDLVQCAGELAKCMQKIAECTRPEISEASCARRF